MKTLTANIAAIVLAVALDSLAKTLAENCLEFASPAPLLGNFFRLTLGYNTGVAFGLFANGGVLPLVLTGLIIVALAAWFVHAIRSGELPPIAGWVTGMILGGAVGNFIDRLLDGRVTDFLDFGLGAARWPTFNLADSFIVVGAVLLLWVGLVSKHPGEDQPS
jgi:signal peptidase II